MRDERCPTGCSDVRPVAARCGTLRRIAVERTQRAARRQRNQCERSFRRPATAETFLAYVRAYAGYCTYTYPIASYRLQRSLSHISHYEIHAANISSVASPLNAVSREQYFRLAAEVAKR